MILLATFLSWFHVSALLSGSPFSNPEEDVPEFLRAVPDGAIAARHHWHGKGKGKGKGMLGKGKGFARHHARAPQDPWEDANSAVQQMGVGEYINFVTKRRLEGLCPPAVKDCPKLGGAEGPPHMRYAYLPLDSSARSTLRPLVTENKSLPNLCINGRNVPELYMPGIPKALTTGMAFDIHDHLGIGFSQGRKEPHFFDNPVGDVAFDLKKVTFENWIDSHAKHEHHKRVCTSDAPRYIMGDFTPGYLYVPEAPERLSEWYKEGGVSHRPIFIISLRNPFERLFSFMYHWNRGINDVEHMDWDPALDTNFTLDAIVNSCLDFTQLQEGRGCPSLKVTVGDGPFQDSLYSKGMMNWLSHFDPKQFIVIPYKVYVNDRPKVMQAIAEKLGLSLDEVPEDVWKQLPWQEGKLENKGALTPEQKKERFVMSEATQARANKYIEPDQTDLFVALSKAVQNGLTLPTYTGRPYKTDIRRWFEMNW